MDGLGLKGFVAVIQAIQEATTLYHKNKYSQEYLAELIDRTREHVNRLEKGRETIGFTTFIKLAQIFNVSLDELAGYKTK